MLGIDTSSSLYFAQHSLTCPSLARNSQRRPTTYSTSTFPFACTPSSYWFPARIPIVVVSTENTVASDRLLRINYGRKLFNMYSKILLANWVSIQRGDIALKGIPEDLPSHFFPADTTKDRTIWFKGVYISIVNEVTNHNIKKIVAEVAEEEHKPHRVPAGYTTYVRGANAYFKGSEDSASWRPNASFSRYPSLWPHQTEKDISCPSPFGNVLPQHAVVCSPWLLSHFHWVLLCMNALRGSGNFSMLFAGAFVYMYFISADEYISDAL